MRIGNVYVCDQDAFSQRESALCEKMYRVIEFADLFCKNGISKSIRPLLLFLTDDKAANGQRFQLGIRLWVDTEKLKGLPDKDFPKEAILQVKKGLTEIAPLHDWTAENIELNFEKVLRTNLQGEWAVSKNISHNGVKFQLIMRYDGNGIITRPENYTHFLMKIKPPGKQSFLVPVSLDGVELLVPSMVSAFSFAGNILTLQISHGVQTKKWQVNFANTITLTDI